MSAKYSTVKSYYDKGLWSAKRVANAVTAGWITTEEYTAITGEDYDND